MYHTRHSILYHGAFMKNAEKLPRFVGKSFRELRLEAFLPYLCTITRRCVIPLLVLMK